MKYVIYIILYSSFMYEIKEFILNGGFNNPIGYSLFKMNIALLLLQLLPEQFQKFFKFIIPYLNIKSEVYFTQNPVLDIRGSSPRRRKNRFQQDPLTD